MELDFGPIHDEIVLEKCDCVCVCCLLESQKVKFIPRKAVVGTACYYVCDRKMLQKLLGCQVCQVREICSFCEECLEYRKFNKLGKD